MIFHKVNVEASQRGFYLDAAMAGDDDNGGCVGTKRSQRGTSDERNAIKIGKKFMCSAFTHAARFASSQNNDGDGCLEIGFFACANRS